MQITKLRKSKSSCIAKGHFSAPESALPPWHKGKGGGAAAPVAPAPLPGDVNNFQCKLG